MGSVPPVSRDALTHHLAVPKIWIETGVFKELPSIPFSYYPMNLDLLYLIPLYFGNDIVPKYIHFAFALFTAFLIYTFLKRRSGTSYALMGCLFFLSIPVIVKLSTTVYVDLGLIFFSTASLLGLLKWMEKGFRVKELMISALFCGLALGTKYNGLIVFFLLSCFVPSIYLRRAGEDIEKKNLSCQFKALNYGLIFVAVSLVVFSPWMIKNTVLTGNPVYPLYNRFFNPVDNKVKAGDSENRPALVKKNAEQKNTGWNHFSVRKFVYGESLWKICLIPLRVFWEGADDDPKRFDGQLNPMLLILPLLLFLPGYEKDHRRNTENRILALFSIAYLVFVFFMVDMRIRWISPIIPPMVILSMSGLEKLRRLESDANVKWKKRVAKGMRVVGISAMLLFNAQYIQALYLKTDAVSYISGQIDRDGYIKKFRPEYEMISYLNRHLPKESVILTLFIGNRIYYFDRPIQLDVNLIRRAVVSSDSIEQISKYINSGGITHMLIRYDLFESWAKDNLDENKRALLKSFFQNQVKPIKSYGGYGLFQLAKTS
jgi:hypothetical protein